MIETLFFTGSLLIVAYLAVRYLAGQLGSIADERPCDQHSSTQSSQYRLSSEGDSIPLNSQEPKTGMGDLPPFAPPQDWQLKSRPTSNPLGMMISAAALVTLIYGWVSFGSFDTAFQKAFPGKTAVQAATVAPQGKDWKEVDGIRWFYLVGTDSSGVGFQGWVPELAFKEAPPEPTPGGKTLLETIGLPSAAEQAKAAKQLKKMSEELRRQNKRNTAGSER